MMSRRSRCSLLLALVFPCCCSSLETLSVSILAAERSQEGKSSLIPLEAKEVKKILHWEGGQVHSRSPHASLLNGHSLHERSGFALTRSASSSKNLHASSAHQGPVEVAHAKDSVLPPTVSPKNVVAEERAAEEYGEVIEDKRWTVHMRAYCTASFASGLTVGVVLTLLLLSLGSDRRPVLKSTKALASSSQRAACTSNPEAPADLADASNSNHSERNSESVESIHRFSPRCGFLVSMLLVQSLSSLMLAGFQDMIQNHPSIVFFLTMVVGTGGNVGGQSVVLAVRRIAYGEEVSLSEQVSVGVQLSAVLAPLALLRAYVQGTKLAVCLVIGVATVLIVITAAALGTALPKLLNRIRVDPAHATPIIQVLMDMVGVLVTCLIGHAVLDVWLKKPPH